MGEQKRGFLSPRIRAKSLEVLGYEMDQVELRLMPYLMYVMMNDQKLDPNKVNAEERKILHKWRMAGHLHGGLHGVAVTKEFWDILCAVVWLGYVDLGGEIEVTQ